MADFETNDVIRISARMLFDEAYAILNVYNVNLDAGGPATFAEMQTPIQDYLDTIYAYMEDEMVDDLTPDSIGVRNETQGTVFGSMAWGDWAGGLSAFDAVPLGCCVLAFGRTKLPRVQARKYFGVFGEDVCVNGVWDGVVRGSCVNALTYHLTQQVPTTGFTFTGIAYNTDTLLKTYATSIASSAEPAYQRRRRRGRGS